MKIQFTEQAIEKLESILESGQSLKLKYDTEGCGCAVNGVPMLWLIDTIEENDREIITNSVSVWIEKSTEVFFDENMVIDFLPKYNSYQLRSNNGILNPRMSLVRKVKS